MNLDTLFTEIRTKTEHICTPLTTEDYVPQPVDFTSPPKWHLAHTTWFFEEMILKKWDPDYQEYNPHFNFLFNSYYNFVGERSLRENRGNMTRPSVETIYAYRKYVDQKMIELIQTRQQEIRDVLLIGLNHEQQHQELLITDIKYTLGHNPIFPVYDEQFNLITTLPTVNKFIDIEAGVYEIGHDGEGFAYDNEMGKHRVFLEEFSISTALVSNQEYLEFINAGGYSSFEYWLDEGWAWTQENNIKSPLYWHFIDGNWHQYTLSGLKKIDLEDAVAHLSFYEANAFANWKGMRLPTEFEWEIAQEQFSWGERWEWTNSAYLPYPKFKIADGALGEYNGKFMINQMVLRGASNATSKNHSRPTYRNFFHPTYQWQFTGIRLAK